MKNAYEQNLAIKFAIASSPTMSKIQDDVSNWPTEQCNEFLNQLELLQAIRLNQNEKSHIDGYTNDELTNAYKFIKQKYKYQQAKRELQTLIKANTLLFFQPSITSKTESAPVIPKQAHEETNLTQPPGSTPTLRKRITNQKNKK